jgi:hypothetical protein
MLPLTNNKKEVEKKEESNVSRPIVADIVIFFGHFWTVQFYPLRIYFKIFYLLLVDG